MGQRLQTFGVAVLIQGDGEKNASLRLASAQLECGPGRNARVD